MNPPFSLAFRSHRPVFENQKSAFKGLSEAWGFGVFGERERLLPLFLSPKTFRTVLSS